MSSRSNKKRKPRKDQANRERTVTTLTGAPNTDYLVPIPTEEPPIFNQAAKMQAPLGTTYQVQHPPNFQFNTGRPPGGNSSFSGNSYDVLSNVAHHQSQQNSYYGPPGAQHHQQQGTSAAAAAAGNATQTRSQETKTTQRLPPGKNDLEILENLKKIIKEGQHPFFRAVPQPAALASLYKGVIPVQDSKDDQSGDTAEKTSIATTQKGAESTQVASSSTAAENGGIASDSAGAGGNLGSNERDQYSPATQLLGELSLAVNGKDGPGAPPTSAASTQDSGRDSGAPPPSSAFSSTSTAMPDEPPRHDDPYDPTRPRDVFSAAGRPPHPDSVYERPPASYSDKDYAYDSKDPLPPRSRTWGGPPPPPARDLDNRSDHDQGYDSRPPSERSTISFGPPPNFPWGIEFGGNGQRPPPPPRRQNDNGRRQRKRRGVEFSIDPLVESSMHIPDLAPGQTDPAELRPLIEKAREEKRKNQLSQGDAAGAAGAAMTATESRPLPTGTMPTEGASTLRTSELPSAQRAAEAAANGEDHDNDIRSSRASSGGGTPRNTTFVIPVSPPFIPMGGIDVPLPEKRSLDDDSRPPIKAERPPYGRAFYGSLPPGETVLDIGNLAPLVHEIKRQEALRVAEEAATYAANSGGRSTIVPPPPQEYPPGPESQRPPPQDNLPPGSGPPPHPPPPARFEGRERERYPPRDIRDSRDTREPRDASPASHAPRRYPPPPPSPPGSVRGPHPHDVPDRERDRDWQYHQGYPRRERWGDHWDPSESYPREYPPPPPRSGGWEARDREYPPRDYPPGPPIDDRDRSYAPPPPVDDRRDRPPPPPGNYNPPYGRVRHRSPSPPIRRAGGPPPDDFRPPAKRPRDDYGDYYTPGPHPPPPPSAGREPPPPHRRGAGDHYPPLPPRGASPLHGPPGGSSWAPPPPPPSAGDRERDRDRERDFRGPRDYARHGPPPMEYPPPPPHGHQHDVYDPRARSPILGNPHPHSHGPPPHGPPPPVQGRPGPPGGYGRGGYGGRDRYGGGRP